MTEEQIKQNADVYANSIDRGRGFHRYLLIREAHIEGAHSRDEEIKELKEEIESLQEQYNTCFDGFTKRGKKMGELMKENVKLRNPWISVKDRLPEEFQMVFVHMQGGAFDCAIYTNGAFERSLQLKFGMKDEGYTIISWEQKFKSNITHWMPIPQIEKGEEI